MYIIKMTNKYFDSFIKYIEEYAGTRGWDWDHKITQNEFMEMCMPINSNDKVINDAPDPVEVMLFFEMIDSNKEGTISVEDLASNFAEVQCFIENGCNYVSYKNEKNNSKKKIPEIKRMLDNVIEEINLKEQDYLGPEEFYNLVVAAVEISHSKR